MNTPLLQFEDVTARFGGLTVIDRLSFEVVPGSRTGLIGPNGAGKSTVFNLISRIYAASSGRILLNGDDLSEVPTELRVQLGIARSFQNIRLMPHLSAVENVILGEHWRRPILSRACSGKAKSRAREALSQAGLSDFAGQIVSNLPYGIQKRLEVVRALFARPKLLLLDEPAAGLNTNETEELRELICTVSAQGISLIIVEHDMNFIRRLCDHVVVLNFGQRIFDGSPSRVHLDQNVQDAYLGKGVSLANVGMDP